MTLYLISGLGVDRRAFQRLSFPEGVRIEYLDWIKPLAGESLAAYALRLSAPINTKEPFGLVGLSFGGMIATEIAKMRSPVCTILISSACTYKEIPVSYRLLGKIQLQKLIPGRLYKTLTPFTYWFFGASTAATKRLLNEIVKDTDPNFIRWALTAILTWRNTSRPEHLYHLHGTRDNVLPYSYVKEAIPIEGAGHLMAFTQGSVVSREIEKILLNV